MRFKWLLASMLLLGTFAFAIPASADVTDFTITDFSANYYLTNTNPQGSLHIREKINVEFTDFNHGILRAIPKTYKQRPLQLHVNSITSDTNAPTQYSSYNSNGNKVLKIGNPNRTVTGHQEYTIDYTLDHVIGFYNDHDELYWDINGDQWQQPFTTVTTTIHLPAGVKRSNQVPQCFAGSFGSSDANCSVVAGNTNVTAVAHNLSSSQTLTVVVGFTKGYFQPATFWDRVNDYRWLIVSVLVPIILGFVIGFVWWFRKGRDAKGRGTIVHEYAPPEGVSPLEAGTIIDFKADNRDLTATIIDLARRGYLKIIEKKQDRKLRKDVVSYSLELTKVDFTDLNAYETRLLEALFDDLKVGTEIDLTKQQHKLYTVAIQIRKDVDANLTKGGFFVRNPYKYVFKGSSVFLLLIFALYIVDGVLKADNLVPMAIGIVAGLTVMGIFIAFLPARTAQGVAAREQLLGLKMYMETAEKDRLEKLEGPEAAYAANVGAPERTVELFEKLLPYAVVLGVETLWAAKFNDIYTSPPDWYSGNWTAFNAGYLAGSLNSGLGTAVNSSFAAPSSSSSSGFGGGGFSGGGGGGGGGGGW